MPSRPLDNIETEIETWIKNSTNRFKEPGSPFIDKQQVWVLKFISPRYLGSFLQSKLLAVSATPGFTWGDGVYVTPICNPYSTMMYGRAGILGKIDAAAVTNVFDACDDRGVGLYQEWIQYGTFLFRQLTTTIHANIANRILRNWFRRRFAIDIVAFPPDQFNRAYVDRTKDRWFVVSDWANVGAQSHGQRPALSRVIKDCEWVALVQEEFEESPAKMHFKDLLGPHITPSGIVRIPANRPNLVSTLFQAYTANRSGVNPAPTIVSIRP
jgi:hypothetical protein